jgi:hypothetical protein
MKALVIFDVAGVGRIACHEGTMSKGLHITDIEWRKLSASVGNRATLGRTVGDAIAEIERGQNRPHGKPFIEVFAEEQVKKPQRGRKQSAGEKRYEELLVVLHAAGVVKFWLSQPWTVELAARTTYNPDFFVVLADGRPAMVEIKGFFAWDDSKVKYKVARKMFPEYRWICLEYAKGKWRILFKNGTEPLELVP